MSKLSISLIEGYHITATDKRHIAEIIRRGWSKGASKYRHYSITERNDDTARVVIESNERTSSGRMEIRRSAVTIRIRGEQS
ncbi:MULTISPECIES: hypothetical protein [Brucellaceae]|uniref:Uncharacterized protein n=1 Tax=Brucella haematophila TaxID=419474 RepID=A0ABX1DV60_9HYPH|nr:MULTISPECIES: hypothetical protein [Brucellaceae]MDM8347044.1 hypothetical protein [Pseudochrobactrum sp. sp1633]NKC05463.1 hypothetical protein [Brucella haematophila]TMU86078.1 hypothetical protein FGI60_25660 [Brucella haematophila]